MDSCTWAFFNALVCLLLMGGNKLESILFISRLVADL
jgi:hypothetical protein